jgi:hypothetical protein
MSTSLGQATKAASAARSFDPVILTGPSGPVTSSGPNTKNSIVREPYIATNSPHDRQTQVANSRCPTFDDRPEVDQT